MRTVMIEEKVVVADAVVMVVEDMAMAMGVASFEDTVVIEDTVVVADAVVMVAVVEDMAMVMGVAAFEDTVVMEEVVVAVSRMWWFLCMW